MIVARFGILALMRRLRSLALGAALAVLAACHRGPQATSAARARHTAAQASAARHALAKDTLGFVAAPRVGKATLALDVKFAPESRPVAGEPLTIDLALIPKNPENAGTLAIVVDPAFSVAAADRSRPLPSLGAGVAYRTQVVVTPTTPGVQVLDLDLTLTDALGSSEARYALPLIVGGTATGTAAASAAASTAASSVVD